MTASSLVDGVKIVINSTGTGAITLGAAVPSFRGTEALINGTQYSYGIQVDGDYEWGTGTYLSASQTLTRTPIWSSNGGIAIDLPANAQVSFVALAEDLYGPSYATQAQAAAAQADADAQQTAIDRAAVESESAAVLAASLLVADGQSVYTSAYASALPRGVVSVTVGGTAITGATPGTYPLTPSGGSITGVAANLVVDSPTSAHVIVTNTGLGSGTTPPTFANPSGATLPSGTTLTAVVDILVPVTKTYWTTSADSTLLVLWSNNGTGTPVAVNNPNGSQVSVAQNVGIASLLNAYAADLEGVPWLAFDALTLSGAGAGFLWTANAIMLAKAVKAIYLHNADPTKQYQIQRLSSNGATDHDRIVIGATDGTAYLSTDNSSVVTRNANGVTRVDIGQSGNYATLFIDYREITDGSYVLGTSSPLLIAKTATNGVLAREAMLGRNRNIAFDGALVGLGAGATFSTPGGTAAPAAANAALTAYGIVGSIALGPSKAYTAVFKVDSAPIRSNGKYAYASVRVYSPDGTTWPTGPMSITPYTAMSGGSIVPGTLTVATGYDYPDPTVTNVRRYWARVKLPATGTIAALSYGLAASQTGTVACEAGGFTISVSDGELANQNVALDDWTGYSTRDTWRDGVDSTLAQAVINYPYGNAIVNGNLDPNRAIPPYSSSVLGSYINPTASPTFAAKGILQSIPAGGSAYVYLRNYILNATASGKYWFASQYVYSPNGMSWPVPQILVYSTTANILSVNMTTFVQIDTNTRLYYASGQLPVRTDMYEVRMGSGTTGLAAVCEIGGFQFDMYTSAIGLGTTNRDDWYYAETRARYTALAGRQAYGSNHLSGKMIAWLGDSISSYSFNQPTLLAAELGCTVGGWAVPGKRWSVSSVSSPTDNDNLSVWQIGQSIASGDWTKPTQAALNIYNAGQGDYRAIVAALAAQDWTKVDLLLAYAGTNDWAAQVPVGATNSTDPTTLNGAINSFVTTVLGAYPTLPIRLGATGWRNNPLTTGGPNVDSNTTPNGAGVYMSDFQAAIVGRAAYYQLSCWEPQKHLGFNIYNYGPTAGAGNGVYSSDWLHPTTPAAQAVYNSRHSADIRRAF